MIEFVLLVYPIEGRVGRLDNGRVRQWFHLSLFHLGLTL